jgi:hypothetical protein
MAQANDADIIATWPPEGVSLRASLRRSPGWPEYEKFHAGTGLIQYAWNSSKPADVLLPDPTLSACKGWIRHQLQSGVLALTCVSMARPFAGPERVTFPAATILYLSFDWETEIISAPNKETYYDPIIVLAASMSFAAEPQPTPLRVETVSQPPVQVASGPPVQVASMPPVEVQSERRIRRKVVRSKHDRLASFNNCIAELVSMFKASPKHRSHTNADLLTMCRKKHRVTWREYQNARKEALKRVPEASATWAKAGRS